MESVGFSEFWEECLFCSKADGTCDDYNESGLQGQAFCSGCRYLNRESDFSPLPTKKEESR